MGTIKWTSTKPDSFFKKVPFNVPENSYKLTELTGKTADDINSKLEEKFVYEIDGYKFYQKHIDELVEMKKYFRLPFNLTVFKTNFNNLANLLSTRDKDNNYNKNFDNTLIYEILIKLVEEHIIDNEEKEKYNILLKNILENKKNNTISFVEGFGFEKIPEIDFSSNENIISSIEQLSKNDYEKFKTFVYSIKRMPQTFYSVILEYLELKDFVDYYSQNSVKIKLYYSKSISNRENAIKIINVLFYKFMEFGDFTKVKALLKYIKRENIEDYENKNSYFIENSKNKENKSIDGIVESKKLGELFENNYDEAIAYFNNKNRKSIPILLTFVEKSNEEDFIDFIDTKHNLNTYHVSSELMNAFISRFIDIGYNSKAISLKNVLIKKGINIIKENNENFSLAEEKIDNVGNDAFDLLRNNLEENQNKILNLQNKVNSFDELKEYFSDLYKYINKNTNSQRTVFINVLERFINSLELIEEKKSELLGIIRLYTKTDVLHIFNNLGINQKNINELNSLGKKPDDFYLTVTSLQQDFPSLYNIFREDLICENIYLKWKQFVEKINGFIDKYGSNLLQNPEKIKKHISELLFRNFKDRQEVYRKELDLLKKEEEELIGENEYFKKYYIFENKKLSIRTRQLYFLLEKNYKVGVEKFGNINKSNSAIFLFLKLAKEEDVKNHQDKIINYYNKIFSTRFDDSKSTSNGDNNISKGKINYETGYESIPISYVYEILKNTSNFNNLCISFENILTENGINLESIKINKETKKPKLSDENKTPEDIVEEIKQKISKVFQNNEFYKLDELLDKLEKAKN